MTGMQFSPLPFVSPTDMPTVLNLMRHSATATTLYDVPRYSDLASWLAPVGAVVTTSRQDEGYRHQMMQLVRNQGATRLVTETENDVFRLWSCIARSGSNLALPGGGGIKTCSVPSLHSNVARLRTFSGARSY